MTTTETVTSDRQAFERILGRLKSDVGTFLRFIPEAKEKGDWVQTAPFWALARMLLPIAESVGDLIHRETSTVKNLTKVLEDQFEAVRSGYKGKAAILAILFRHSLIHTDELRVLEYGTKRVVWSISWNARGDHLRVTTDVDGSFRLKFDTTAFFDDLVAVVEREKERPWNSKVMERYNSWLSLAIENKGKQKPVVAEIERLARELEADKGSGVVDKTPDPSFAPTI